MATIDFSISSKINKVDGQSEILARFYQGSINQRGKTGVFGPGKYWDAEKQRFVTPKTQKRLLSKEEESLINKVNELNGELADIERHVLEQFRKANCGRAGLPKKWLAECLAERRLSSSKKTVAKIGFFDVFEKFLRQKKFSSTRHNHYMVNIRELKRFSIFEDFELDLDNFDSDLLCDIQDFLEIEHTYLYKDDDGNLVFTDPRYEVAFNAVPESRVPSGRSDNTISGKLTRLHTFFLWAKKNGYTSNDPFVNFTIKTPVYGDPIPLTREERDALYAADFSSDPSLAEHRDIFILQCFIGCRIGDYFDMTKGNYYDGAIHYIPQKTHLGKLLHVYLVRPEPLEILKRYAHVDGDRLMPFPSEAEYNRSIKEMIVRAGIDRVVTVLDGKGKECQSMLSKEVSSHTARRTFINLLYQEVKDPNLVAKVSGHAENSRAFNRYRHINEDNARDLLSKL